MAEMEYEDLDMQRNQLIGRITEIQGLVEKSTKVRVYAREEISERLKEALQYLEGETLTYQSIISANLAIDKARERFKHAQEMSVKSALTMGTWIIVVIAISVFSIVKWELIPNTPKMPISHILIGAAIWGTLGSAIDGIRVLHLRVFRQEYDPNRAVWYLAHPIVGAGLGSIVFLLTICGLLSVAHFDILPIVTDTTGFNPALVFVLAVLAGFEQEAITNYLQNVALTIFRIDKQTPSHESGEY